MGNPAGIFGITGVEGGQSLMSLNTIIHRQLSTQKEVVRQCQRENPFAQKRLYDRYANRLYRLVCRYVSNSMETEEVLMNGFLKIFKAIVTFEYRSDDELEV